MPSLEPWNGVPAASGDRSGGAGEEKSIAESPRRARLCAATEPSGVAGWVAEQPEEQPAPFARPSTVKNGCPRFICPCLEVFSSWVFLEGKNGRSEMISCW